MALILLLGCPGCGRDALASRRSLDLEQALHGHWSSRQELVLAAGAAPWQTDGAKELWGTEIDRFIDAQSEPKVWSEVAGELCWRMTSQDPASCEVEVEIWSETTRGSISKRTLRLDSNRTTLLERLPGTRDVVRLRMWNYVNDQCRP